MEERKAYKRIREAIEVEIEIEIDRHTNTQISCKGHSADSSALIELLKLRSARNLFRRNCVRWFHLAASQSSRPGKAMIKAGERMRMRMREIAIRT